MYLAKHPVMKKIPFRYPHRFSSSLNILPLRSHHHLFEFSDVDYEDEIADGSKTHWGEDSK